MPVDKRKSRSRDGLLDAAAGGGTLDLVLRGKSRRIEFPEGFTIRSVLAQNDGNLSIELELWGNVRAALRIDTAPLHLNADDLIALDEGLPALCRLMLEHGVTSAGIKKHAKR